MNGCKMCRPLSGTFSNIYMVKPESNTVIPSRPISYERFVDDIYSRRKIGETGWIILNRVLNLL